MLRLPTTPRIVAALSLCIGAAVTTAPASAYVMPSEATTAATIQSIYPQLPDYKAHAYARSVIADATRTGLDPKFIMSIVTVESRWRAAAISYVGAEGLGQLMPETAAQLGVNPRNPADNLRGTSSYLKSLATHFAGQKDAVKKTIASYNAGPGAVEAYHGVPPYPETRDYVRKVLVTMGTLKSRLHDDAPLQVAWRSQPQPRSAKAAPREPAQAHADAHAQDVSRSASPLDGAKKLLASVSLWPPFTRMLDFQLPFFN